MNNDQRENRSGGHGLTAEDASLDLPPCMFRSGDNAEKTTIAMQRLLIGPHYSPAKFTAVDGLALFEGDIVLGSAEEARAATQAKGVGITGDQYRWPGGVVFYVVEQTLGPLVKAAMEHWEARTPIRFKPSDNETDYVSFERRDGCWSRVGRQGNMQVISLGAGCGLGAAIHEIGHTLGLWHEQSRSDRDDYVEVVKANIISQHLHNFDKHIQDGDDLGDYDYGSIMHYPATAFSSNGQPTILAKGGQPIGQRNGLSRGDILAVKMMYPGLNWAPYV
jgi:hypothetical protein